MVGKGEMGGQEHCFGKSGYSDYLVSCLLLFPPPIPQTHVVQGLDNFIRLLEGLSQEGA